MDREFIKKHGLQESLKKFKMLSEYTFITNNTLDEDDPDKDNNNNSAQGGGNDPMQGGMGGGNNNQGVGGDDMGLPGGNSDSGMMGGPGDDSNTAANNGGADNGQGGGDDSNPDDRQLGDTLPGADGGDGEGGDDFDFGNGDDDNNEGGEEDDDVEKEQDGDEVIDVDDLTDSQEDTEKKIDYMNSKLDSVLPLIDKFVDMITKNNAQIEDLKHEIEERNPSEIEKLNLRSQDSMPFNVKPEEFWKEKAAERPNYEISMDNSVPNSKEAEDGKQYTIRKGDIANSGNLKAISDSFNDDDYDLSLSKIFGL